MSPGAHEGQAVPASYKTFAVLFKSDKCLGSDRGKKTST